MGTWEDTTISSNARVRFYAAARRIDSDADGLSDGAEVLIHRTDPSLADTDEDGHSDGREVALGTDPLDGTDYFGIVINSALPIPPPPGSEVGREWVELFNVGSSPKSLDGFRLQTALPSGWVNVFTFPSNTTLDSGDFMLIGNSTNGDYSANLLMPNSSFDPPGMFGIRLVKDTTSFYVADALLYGFTNEYGLSLDGFGEEMPIVRPWTNWVIRRTWIGYDTDHAGDWMKVPAETWTPHTQGDYLDLDGDGLSNSNEMAGGLYPLEGGTRIDETDSDFDGLSDAYELANGLDPNNVDSDGDAFPWDDNSPPSGNDADELASGTDPLDPDTDNDFVPDGWELASPAAGGQKSTGGILDPLSTDTDQDAMPDGDEDSDGDGIPNAVEVANLTNPFDADDVDPCPYLWLKNGEAMESLFDEGDIGYDTLLTYWIKAQTNCPPIMVRVNEGGHVVESFHVTWDDNITCTWLNSNAVPPTNRIYYIETHGRTSFWFKVRDGKTTWENENPAEYGADILMEHAPATLDLDAGVPEVSEETVGFLLADKSAHAEALRKPVSIIGPENTWGYVTNLILSYETSFLTVYDNDVGGNVILSGTRFLVSNVPPLYVEGVAHSGSMRDAWIQIDGAPIPVSDRANGTVLKADIGTVEPLADRTLHPEAPRVPLLLKQALPANWNGLMRLAMDGAVAFWTPTGGTPIVLGSTVFTNAQLSQTIYLEGDGCGTNGAVFSVVGLDDCKTNLALSIFGMNATLAGVVEADELAPGGFIADRSVHTNAPRTMLTLEACGPVAATGNVVLTWNSSVVQIYTAAAGGSPLAQFSRPYNGFTATNLYVEGIAPGSNTLAWTYSGQSDCVDNILVTALQLNITKPVNLIRGVSGALNATLSPSVAPDIVEWIFTGGQGGTKNTSPNLSASVVLVDGDNSYSVMCRVVVGSAVCQDTAAMIVTPRNWSITPNCATDNESGFGSFPGAVVLGYCRNRTLDNGRIVTPTDGGFTCAQVNDPNGPNDDYWYIESTSLEIDMETVINKYAKSGTMPPSPPGTNWHEYNESQGVDADGCLSGIKGHEYRGVGGSGNGHFAFLEAKESQAGMDARAEIENNWHDSSETTLATVTEAEKDSIDASIWAAYFVEPSGNWGPNTVHCYGTTNWWTTTYGN